jgi:hypothetical protein
MPAMEKPRGIGPCFRRDDAGKGAALPAFFAAHHPEWRQMEMAGLL